MIYAVSDEGVQALQKMAADLSAAAEEMTAAANRLQAAAEDNAAALGPHQASLNSALEEVRAAQQSAAAPVSDICDKLNGVAQKYQDIISDDPFGGIGAGN